MPGGRSSGSPTTCCCRWPVSLADADARLAPLDRPRRSWRLVEQLPDAWLPGRPVRGRRRRPAAAVRGLSRATARRRRARSSRMRSVPVPPPPRDVFQYAIVRVVPRVERGEQLNVGVDPAVPPEALPRGADRARRGRLARVRAGLDPRRSGRTSRRSSASPRATRRPARSPGSIRPSGSTGWSRRPARSSSRPRSTRACATTRRPSSTTWSRSSSAEPARQAARSSGGDLDHRRVGGHRRRGPGSRHALVGDPLGDALSLGRVGDDPGRRRQVRGDRALQVDVRCGSASRLSSQARLRSCAGHAADVDAPVDDVEDDLDPARAAASGVRWW